MIILRNGISAKEYLAQREYSKLGELVKRTRENLAGRITNSAVSEINKQIEAESKPITKIKFPKFIRSGIYKEANKNNARVTGITIEDGSVVVPTKDLVLNKVASSKTLKPKKRQRKLERSILKGNRKYQILVNPGTSADQIAHEIGHIQMRESKNPIVRAIDNRARISRDSINTSYNNITSMLGPENNFRSGIKNLTEDIINGESLIASESGASRRGLRILRRMGATKDQLLDAKNNYKIALDNYKGTSRANWKTTLRNTIQTPEKRKDSIFYDKNPSKKD